MTSKIPTQIAESPLTDEEKIVVSSIIDTLGADMQSELEHLFEESPWLIPYIYVNYAAKNYALSSKDKDAFRTVIENEVSVLESIKENE